MGRARLYIVLTFFLLSAGQCMAQDSILHNLQDIPFKYVNAVDNKIEKYSNRISRRTEKALEKLSKWENKIHTLLNKTNPQAAERLFGNNQTTFATLLQKYKEGKRLAENSKAKFDDYRDKLTCQLKYIEEQKEAINKKLVKPVTEAKEKLTALEDDIQDSEALEKFIKERKKQLMEQAIQYIGNSKYLTKINKESYYYVETLRNYKELFHDKEKAEKTALTILNKIPAFQQFIKNNSMLASLFRVPGGYGTAQASTAGLQTRASMNAMIQTRLAAGGPNAQAQLHQNLDQAKAQLSQLKDRIMKAGGNNSDMDIPDFKPKIVKTKTFWQRIEYGSDFQFAKNNTLMPTTADIALNIGYKLNDKSIIGLGGSYKMGLGSIQHLSITHQGIGLRSFIDWKLKKQFFVSGGFEMNHNAAFKNIEQLKSFNEWQQAGLVGLTKKIKIKTKWTKGTKFQLLYDLFARQHVPVSQPVLFRIGYNF